MFLTTVFLSRWRSFWGGHCFSDFGPSFRWSTSHLSVWDRYHRIRHEILLHFDLYLDPCCKLSHRSSPVLLFFEDEHFIFWPFSEIPISFLQYWASSVETHFPPWQIWFFIDPILYISLKLSQFFNQFVLNFVTHKKMNFELEIDVLGGLVFLSKVLKTHSWLYDQTYLVGV